MIDLALVPQFVRHLGFDEHHVQRSPLGIEGILMQPKFSTTKFWTQSLVSTERPVLAGSFVFQKPEPHVELFILRASKKLLPREADVPAPRPLPQ